MRVQDQRHGSIAENGGAGHHLNVRDKPAQVLDDGLMISEHFVHDESVMSVLGFDHHDLLALRPGRVHLEVLAEPDVGNCLAAHVGDVIAVARLDVLPRQLDAFEAVGQGQHEMRLADADQQPVDDGQRQGKAKGNGETRPRPVGDVDGAAQRLDASPDDVHAHAPSGDLGHLPRGGEAGRQDEREESRPPKARAAASISPCSIARARTASTSRPRPSSLTGSARWRRSAGPKGGWLPWGASRPRGGLPGSRCRDPCCCGSDGPADRSAGRSRSCRVPCRRLRW